MGKAEYHRHGKLCGGFKPVYTAHRILVSTLQVD